MSGGRLACRSSCLVWKAVISYLALLLLTCKEYSIGGQYTNSNKLAVIWSCCHTMPLSDATIATVHPLLQYNAMPPPEIPLHWHCHQVLGIDVNASSVHA